MVYGMASHILHGTFDMYVGSARVYSSDYLIYATLKLMRSDKDSRIILHELYILRKVYLISYITLTRTNNSFFKFLFYVSNISIVCTKTTVRPTHNLAFEMTANCSTI
jgi:hypothetical protein